MSALVEQRNRYDTDLYDGWAFEEDDGYNRVWAIGKTPLEAIQAFAEARGVGEVDVDSLNSLDGGDENYHWGYRFWAGGVSFKAAGQEVPGGVVLTWWK